MVVVQKMPVVSSFTNGRINISSEKIELTLGNDSSVILIGAIYCI